MTAPHGRALDEACARAMGWQDLGSLYWCQGNRFSEGAPHYSTDPATQAEMIAWLDAHLSDWCIQHVQGDTFDMQGDAFGSEVNAIECATINEALARLVVAVAESEAKP